MEGCGKDISLSNQYRGALMVSQNFNLFAGCDDAWGADENGLNRLLLPGRLNGLNETVALSAIRIALNGEVNQLEGRLVRAQSLFG